MSFDPVSVSHLDTLRSIGLTQPILNALAAIDAPPGARPMRVIELQRERLALHDGVRVHVARSRLSRRVALQAADRGARACANGAVAVGDWVLAVADAYGEWSVVALMAPHTQLTRRTNDGGGGLVRQAIVHNVDTALLLMGLDHDFNLRRLDRYLALVRTAGVGAVVVLTKADACPDVAAARLDAVRARLRESEDAIAVDARDARIRAAFAPWLATGRTLVLLGSSGCGKSTLTNTLLGRAVQHTGPVREDDGRGRHTTSVRTLHRCDAGACIIDTPGLRALRPDADADEIGAAFDDIAALAARCRFRDCRHAGEPGCVVRERVEPDRLSSFHKLQREARRDAMTPLEKQEELSLWKSRGRAARERARHKQGLY